MNIYSYFPNFKKEIKETWNNLIHQSVNFAQLESRRMEETKAFMRKQPKLNKSLREQSLGEIKELFSFDFSLSDFDILDLKEKNRLGGKI